MSQNLQEVFLPSPPPTVSGQPQTPIQSQFRGNAEKRLEALGKASPGYLASRMADGQIDGYFPNSRQKERGRAKGWQVRPAASKSGNIWKHSRESLIFILTRVKRQIEREKRVLSEI